MVTSDIEPIIRDKEINSYPVIFRLYSVEHQVDLDFDLVCSIYFKESNVQLIKEKNITILNTITHVDGSELNILIPVPAIEYLCGDFIGDIFGEDVNDSCSLCLDEKEEPINIYQILDYGLYAHNSCIVELTDEFLEFCSECPEIISRTL